MGARRGPELGGTVQGLEEEVHFCVGSGVAVLGQEGRSPLGQEGN